MRCWYTLVQAKHRIGYSIGSCERPLLVETSRAKDFKQFVPISTTILPLLVDIMWHIDSSTGVFWGAHTPNTGFDLVQLLPLKSFLTECTTDATTRLQVCIILSNTIGDSLCVSNI
jgi:hypothetical protein